jgi:hypothetical protein
MALGAGLLPYVPLPALSAGIRVSVPHAVTGRGQRSDREHASTPPVSPMPATNSLAHCISMALGAECCRTHHCQPCACRDKGVGSTCGDRARPAKRSGAREHATCEPHAGWKLPGTLRLNGARRRVLPYTSLPALPAGIRVSVPHAVTGRGKRSDREHASTPPVSPMPATNSPSDQCAWAAP